MVTPFNTLTHNQDLYVSALSALWSYYQKLPQPGYALSKDIEALEVILRDPKIYQGYQQRLNNIAGRDFKVAAQSKTPQDTLLASIVQDAISSVRNFRESRKLLAKAVFTGQSWAKINGQRKTVSLGGTLPMEWWVPVELENVDYRRFIIRPVVEKRLDGTEIIKSELWVSVVNSKELTNTNLLELGWYKKLDHPEWFVNLVYENEESRLGYGRGIMDTLYFYSWAKNVVFREGLQGVERWSQGIVIGKMDPNREASTDKTNADLQTAFERELKQHRSEHVFTVQSGDEVEVIETAGTGHQMVVDFLRYIDEAMIAVCTGSILSSGTGGDTGSYSRDQVGREIQESIVQFDRDKLDEELTKDLIGLFLRLNRSNIAALGLQSAKTPKFETTSEQHVDPSEAASRIETLQRAGMKLIRSEAYAAVGFTPPGPNDEILEPPQQQNQIPFPFDFGKALPTAIPNSVAS